MAYHRMGEDLSVIAADQDYDQLDACAYQLLAALFSIVEPELHQSLTTYYLKVLKKPDGVRLLQFHDEVRTWRFAFGDELVQEILAMFRVPQKERANASKRVFSNPQLHTMWQNAFNGPPDEFATALSRTMARLAMANLPGEQCTAVIRHDHRLYVTANGLWGSGESLEATPDDVLYAGDVPKMLNRPWFPSASQFERALDMVSGDILGEYNVRAVVYVNPMVGDFGGKFHAEMQLLEFMIDEHILPDRGYMGVSKPCCNFCQERLNAVGVQFWTGHMIRGNDPVPSVGELYRTFNSAQEQQRFRDAVRLVPFYGAIMPS
jgi:hypothetical protein